MMAEALMRLAVALLVGTALCAAPAALPGAGAAEAQVLHSTPKPDEGWQPRRTSFGQADMMGYWSNSSLTPMVRAANVRDRLVYTDEEVREIEGRVQIEIEEGNAPTDPDAPAEYRNPTTVERPEFLAAGGDVGGYNRGWLDPGSRVGRVNGEPRTSVFTTPNGAPPPRKAGATPPAPPAGRPIPVNSFESYETRSLGERCVIGFGRNAGPPMFANGFYNNNYRIVQSPDHVVIEVEMNHDARIIRLNSEHRRDGVRPYFGDSIGWWEGDTLVVSTINLPRSQAFMGSWENLKVNERFTRVGEDRLHYAFAVEDPTLWEQPWGGEYEFTPLDGVIYEYACHEGNYALPGILLGARVEEARAAKSDAKPKSGVSPASAR
jgi:hypothetical protein